jgi:acyl-CoA reductase-like NAD-dependent aldehyde dehydrogenase
MAQSPEGYVHTVDIGSMINGTRFGGLEVLIGQAEEEGATVFEGQPYTHAYYDHGYYFRPSIVADARPDMAIAQEERE